VSTDIFDSRAMRRVLAAYQKPDRARGVFEILVTTAPLALLCGLSWFALDRGWGAALLLTVPAAAFFLVRLFMIQHDCGHGSFFEAKAANDWVGRVIGVLTLTPYDYWRRTHAIHHATSGNLDRRWLGAVETLTVEEYRALPPLKRLGYRLYRNPLVMFGIGPAYMFLVQHRLPVGLMKEGWRPWLSTMGTNLGAIVLATALILLVGPAAFFLVYVPVVVIAAAIGVWLFYVQHQFDGAYWVRNGEWDLHEASLHGSSYYVLPPVLRWMTADIGAHHVHHAASRIPFYRLPQVLKDIPELNQVSRLTIRESLSCVKLALWDEASRRLVSFREATARKTAAV